jgi:pyruvate,water dikinase
MSVKKRIDVSEKYVKWLSELDKTSGPIVGGKGANLAEMYNSGFPVPPAFCVTAQAFDSYLIKAGLKQKIADIIAKTNVDNTEELDTNSAKIREMISGSDMLEEMEQEIIEAYELLSSDNKGDELIESKNPKKTEDTLAFVAVRSSATTEDLAAASFAGQQETFTNIRGKKQLIEAVKKCFASLFTARAVYYRHKKGFDKANALLSVVIQKMISSEKSGVMFTKNPTNGKNEIIIEAVFGLGEGIVSGKILPDQYILSNDLDILETKIANKKIALIKEENGNGKEIKLSPEKSKTQVLNNLQISSLGSLGLRLEKHYGKPQDIEFAIDNNKIYIVQTRPITTLAHENLKKSVEIKGNIILSGLAASPGVAAGVVKIVQTMADLPKIKKGDILVTKMTNPDMVVTMQRAVAVITDEGGATAHAAIVSREMGIPCVVGTEKATEILKDGQIVTVDGTNGKVYEGKVSNELSVGKKEILPVVKTKIKIKVMVDLPHFAERAAKSQCDSVGLMRLEGIIAESGKHPAYFLKEKDIEAYCKIIEKGVEKITHHFKNLWIRTSDIRSDEYKNLQGAPKEVELNPMLGMHGIRFSLKNLPIFEAELEAIRRVAEKYPDKKFGVMFPQVINEKEIVDAYKIFKRYGRGNMFIGAMIETPAAVQIIREICKYVKFISFGTNDLTQYTLAIDRGNSECQYLYDEMNPAVLSQLRKVIMVCKQYKVETSICGQAGSRKEMVKFLVENGIDSISVNADMANEISILVQEMENGRIKNPSNTNTNMASKSKIIPLDDVGENSHIAEKGKEAMNKAKIEGKKSQAQKSEGKTEITEEDLRNKETKKEEKKDEKKQEEFPDFELGFDPFQSQV